MPYVSLYLVLWITNHHQDMRLYEFIEKLQKLQKEHGDDPILTMADFIEIAEPLFVATNDGPGVIVITDEAEEDEEEEGCACGNYPSTKEEQGCKKCCDGNYCAFGCGKCFCPCHD